MLCHLRNHHGNGCPGRLLQAALQGIRLRFSCLPILCSSLGNPYHLPARIGEGRFQENIVLSYIQVSHLADDLNGHPLVAKNCFSD
jgi:hypothetical protein